MKFSAVTVQSSSADVKVCVNSIVDRAPTLGDEPILKTIFVADQCGSMRLVPFSITATSFNSANGKLSDFLINLYQLGIISKSSLVDSVLRSRFGLKKIFRSPVS